MTRLSAPEISAALRRCRASWLPRTFPAGVVRGNVFLLGDADGTPGDSFPIPLNAEKGAGLADFGGDFAGDDLNLWARGRRLSLADAIKDAARWLGVDCGGRPEHKPVAAARPKRGAARSETTRAEPAPAGTPSPDQHPMVRKADGAWRYHDAAGQMLLLHLRFDELGEAGRPVLDRRGKPKKSFRPLIWRNGSWASAWPDVRPLYGLFELAARPVAAVLVVEGEKTCDAARKLLSEYAVITWPQGSSGAPKADWTPLQGRTVMVWPDADEPGVKAGGVVAELVRKAGAAAVALVRLPDGLPDGWDLADPLPAGWAIETVRGLIAGAEPAPGDSAPTPAPADPPSGKPVIRLQGGELPEIIDAAEAALIAAECPLYQRGGLVVRPALAPVRVSDGRELPSPRLAIVTVHHVAEQMTAAAIWEKFDGRSNRWVAADAPLRMAETWLAREGLWGVPVLTGLIGAPTLRGDGSILERPGYDAATGLLLDPHGVSFAPLTPFPTIKQARAALDTLKGLIATFPFVGAADCAVALSAILTASIRPSLPTAPLHGFTAPTAGSGKSLLVDIVSMITTGRLCSVISQGKTEEEFEKRLGAALISGDALINVDNCEAPLGGDLMCQALTQQTLKIRVLGKSVNADVPATAAVFATGNNLILSGDMTRRALLCSLDCEVERPELRTFEIDPISAVRANRNLYVRAALTILRAFHVAGRPQQTAPLGSFTDWSGWVRDSLIWLGEADPCLTMERARSEDPRRDALAAVLTQWREVIGERRVSVREVIDAATVPSSTMGMPGSAAFVKPDFREALLVVAGDGGNVNSRRLGKWLSKNKLRVINRLRIVEDTGRAGVATWRLEIVQLVAGGYGGNGGCPTYTPREMSVKNDSNNESLYIVGGGNPPRHPNPPSGPDADDDCIAGWQS